MLTIRNMLDLILLVNVDALATPLTLTAKAQETGVAQSHVRHFARQDGLARVGCTGRKTVLADVTGSHV